jgi:hypothetical protein
MPTFDDLRSFNDALIRKALQAAVFIAPMTATDEITALKDASGLLALPAGYEDVGRLTSDGITWPREVETSEVTSLGVASPTRRDIVSDVASVSFVMQESKQTTLSLYEGQDLAAATYDANGNVFWDRPDRPASRYHRFFAIYKDGEGVDATYGAVWLPRAQVTDRTEIAWSAESEINYGVTLTAFVDESFGTSVRTLRAGPADHMGAEGFTAAGV